MSLIPKKLHYCWFGGSPLPERDQKCLESWRRVCPDWEIIRWDESNYDVSKNAYMRQAYQVEKWGFVPDFARLDIVASEGGVYLDTDVELLKAPDELLDYAGYMGWSQDGYINPGQGFGAEAGNRFVMALVHMYESLSFVNDDGSLNLLPSPHYATDCLVELGFEKGGAFQSLDGFVLLPAACLDPLDAATGRVGLVEETISIHHYFGSWLTERVKYQKELRRSLNSKHVPDALAWPLSRGIAYVKYEGLGAAVRRVFTGKQKAADGQAD